jgi:hypothetical protein
VALAPSGVSACFLADAAGAVDECDFVLGFMGFLVVEWGRRKIDVMERRKACSVRHCLGGRRDTRVPWATFTTCCGDEDEPSFKICVNKPLGGWWGGLPGGLNRDYSLVLRPHAVSIPGWQAPCCPAALQHRTLVCVVWVVSCHAVLFVTKALKATFSMGGRVFPRSFFRRNILPPLTHSSRGVHPEWSIDKLRCAFQAP